jgi:hypothetical protein
MGLYRWTFIGILVCIAGIWAMVNAFPNVNGWLVGIGTLVVELVLAVVILAAAASLSLGRGLKRRNAMIDRRGWTFAGQAELPVPGPRSARLLNLPDDAVTMTGSAVIQANGNGLAVTIFNKVPADLTKERAQIVFMVRLPMALPYLHSLYTTFVMSDKWEDKLLGAVVSPHLVSGRQAGDPAQWTDDDAFAKAFMTPQIRQATDGLLYHYWIENGFLCTTEREGEKSLSLEAKEMEFRVDELTSFVTRLPWNQLAPWARA